MTNAERVRLPVPQSAIPNPHSSPHSAFPIPQSAIGHATKVQYPLAFRSDSFLLVKAETQEKPVVYIIDDDPSVLRGLKGT